ncbi:nitronate monooxygenase [Bacillus sp. FJAT-49736]|uniref:NAD(P)H-dependent flavin oxidoreductase n=1 Tax=Bacillus sp. FJAT-49736 TaxID=2833582 RepID=UPI001BC9D640|nr:nitronate monooxygenase [Bacillus sp. FJAT-49736]MBS4175453.1 nitronate monooxygenase [Bacillus sp. FJAT-49736]
MFKNDITQFLNIKYPIIQAPMAGGITTSALVAAVSNAGGLGMIGAGYMNPDQIREQIKEVKGMTENPFGINLFVPEDTGEDASILASAYQALQPFRDRLKIKSSLPSVSYKSSFEDQFMVILEEKVPVCSFTFGLPTANQIESLKAKGIVVIGTATTVEEAILVEKAGMDAVVVQGSEAGGHRGTFAGEMADSLIGLMSLVPQVADSVNIPVIAAGGIMDERGILASICLGANGVQMGTAFLTCMESGAHEQHKKAILEARENETTLTNAFSGKYARGIKNNFISGMEERKSIIAPYPIQNSLTQEIRKVAARQGLPDFMSLWSGQSPRLSRSETVQELIDRIVKGCRFPS